MHTVVLPETHQTTMNHSSQPRPRTSTTAMVANGYVLTDVSGEPVSRTYQYRKVMKPMLERKRRARINRCLDELKDLMAGAFQADGENVTKLEKADILELTVRHLQKMRHHTSARRDQTYADKFKAGFRQCAAEVTHFLGQVDQGTSVHVLQHLSGCIKQLEVLPVATAAPPTLRPAAHYDTQSVDSNDPAEHDMPYDEDDDDDEDLDRMNTPPQSPEVDIDGDDMPVWRPW